MLENQSHEQKLIKDCKKFYRLSFLTSLNKLYASFSENTGHRWGGGTGALGRSEPAQRGGRNRHKGEVGTGVLGKPEVFFRGPGKSASDSLAPHPGQDYVLSGFSAIIYFWARPQKAAV